MAGIALALGFYALSESRLASKSQAEPTTISMSDLIANGAPDNVYLTVTGVSAEVEEYVYEYRGRDESKYTKVYIPCRARGQDGQRVGMVMLSTELNSDMEVRPLGFKQQFTGMIINEIRSLKKMEMNLLKSIPGVNAGTSLIFELNREPSSTGGLIAMFGLSGTMLLGAMGWMFLTGSPDATPAAKPSRSRNLKSGRQSSKQSGRSASRSQYSHHSAGPVSIGHLLFGFQGRIGVGQYLIGGVVSTVLCILGLVLSLLIFGEGSPVPFIVGIASSFWTGLATTVKRLQDRNLSGVTCLLGLIPVLGALTLMVICLMPGTDGPNQYGPQP